jgi:hypothetical protein
MAKVSQRVLSLQVFRLKFCTHFSSPPWEQGVMYSEHRTSHRGRLANSLSWSSHGGRAVTVWSRYHSLGWVEAVLDLQQPWRPDGAEHRPCAGGSDTPVVRKRISLSSSETNIQRIDTLRKMRSLFMVDLVFVPERENFDCKTCIRPERRRSDRNTLLQWFLFLSFGEGPQHPSSLFVQKPIRLYLCS